MIAVVAVAAVGCGEISPDPGAGPSSSVPPTTQGVAATTTLGSSTTLGTTTTLTEEDPQAPPKPEGEPDIELLPARPIVFTMDDIARTFSFEAVSGHSSYRATFTSIFTTAKGVLSSFLEASVDGASIQFRASTGDDLPYEVLLLEDDTYWIERFGEWTQGEGDGDYGYAALLGLTMILPNSQHGAFYDAFDSLVFRDWELIDGAWYARYDPSPRFVAALGGDSLSPNDIPGVKGAVWVSPLGFMHSYELELEDTESGERLETTWRLSDLGSTMIDVPETPFESETSVVPEALPEAATLTELLASEFWDPTVLLGAEPFRWRGQSLRYLTDLDPEDNAGYGGSRDTSDLWGSVARGGIDRQHTFGVLVGTRKAAESIVYDGTWWQRLGTTDNEGMFTPNDENWTTGEGPAFPAQVAGGLLAEGYRLFNDYGTPTLELVGPDEIDGVSATRYTAVVKDGGDSTFWFDATFDFWIESGVDVARLLKLTYSAESLTDMFTNGVVTGTQTRVMDLELYDIGDDTVEISPP